MLQKIMLVPKKGHIFIGSSKICLLCMQKIVCVCVLVAQSCPTLCDPMGCSPPASLSIEFSRPQYWGGQAFPSPEDLPNPGIEPRSLALPADSLPAEPQGKPKNTGVGSLFLLQGIFLTQELNWGLLHFRQILYQLSYQGSPWQTQRAYQKEETSLYQQRSV